MRYFVFDGVDSRDHGWLMKLERSALPALENVFIKLPRRAGAYVPKKRSREIAPMTFTVKLGILGNSNEDFRARVRSLAKWLFNANANGEAAPIWFSDEPARIYYVWLEGTTDLEEVAATGEIVLSFVATDPIANSTALSTTLFDTAGAANLMVLGYHDFEGLTLGATLAGQSITVIDDKHARSGTKAVKGISRTATNNGIYLGASSTDYNIPVTGGAAYIFSFYAYAEVSCLLQIHVAFNTAGTNKLLTGTQITIPPNEWTRHYMVVTAPADATLAVARMDYDQANTEVWFDDLQFEAANTGQTLPSEYKAPPAVSVKKQIRNAGTAATYPDFHIVPSAAISYLKISDGKGNYIFINRTIAANSAVIINNRKGEVYLEASGASLMADLTIESRFFKLEPETDYVLTAEANTGSLTVRVNWQEKFL